MINLAYGEKNKIGKILAAERGWVSKILTRGPRPKGAARGPKGSKLHGGLTLLHGEEQEWHIYAVWLCCVDWVKDLRLMYNRPCLKAPLVMKQLLPPYQRHKEIFPSPQYQPTQTYCTAGEVLLTWCAGLWARAQACYNYRKRTITGWSYDFEAGGSEAADVTFLQTGRPEGKWNECKMQTTTFFVCWCPVPCFETVNPSW